MYLTARCNQVHLKYFPPLQSNCLELFSKASVEMPFEQLVNWFCGSIFQVAILLLLILLMSSKCFPYSICFIFRKRQKQKSRFVFPLRIPHSQGHMNRCLSCELLAKRLGYFQLTFPSCHYDDALKQFGIYIKCTVHTT